MHQNEEKLAYNKMIQKLAAEVSLGPAPFKRVERLEHLAKPGHKTCHGTGLVGFVRIDLPDQIRAYPVICICRRRREAARKAFLKRLEGKNEDV